MATNDAAPGRGRRAQSNAEAINQQLAKIRELERGVESLKEKEARRLFRMIERAGWFEVSVPDDAFAETMAALVARHRDEPARPFEPVADGADPSGAD